MPLNNWFAFLGLSENKKSLALTASSLIIIILGFYSFQIYKDDHREQLSDKYNTAVIDYSKGNESKAILAMEEVIENQDSTYSPLALYFLIDNTNLLKCQSPNILISQSSNLLIYQSPNLLITNLLICQSPNLLITSSNNLPISCPRNRNRFFFWPLLIYWSTNLQIYWSTNLLICQSANLLISQSPNLLIYQSTDLPICQSTDLPIS